MHVSSSMHAFLQKENVGRELTLAFLRMNENRPVVSFSYRMYRFLDTILSKFCGIHNHLLELVCSFPFSFFE
jgi:hypothetical protein